MDMQALWLNFRDAVANHYFDLNGRVGRAQFWYFALVYLGLAIVAAILQAIVWLPLMALFNLAMLLPTTGMGARRLQDTGRDGRLVWLGVLLWAVTQIVSFLTALSVWAVGPFGAWAFLPGLGLLGLASFVVGVVLIWFWVQPGDPAPNAYGPPPPVFDPAVKPAT
jgi:uncharacterized membrane protein YhaH (DUF805 family)